MLINVQTAVCGEDPRRAALAGSQSWLVWWRGLVGASKGENSSCPPCQPPCFGE